MKPALYPYTKDKLVQNCISLLTTNGVLEAAYAKSEEVRAVVQQVMDGHKPELQSGETIPADHPDAGAAGAIVRGKQDSHERHK